MFYNEGNTPRGDDDDEQPFTPAFAKTLRKWPEAEAKEIRDARIEYELVRVRKCLAKQAKTRDPPYPVFVAGDKMDNILLDAVRKHYESNGWDVHAGKDEGFLENTYDCYWFHLRK